MLISNLNMPASQFDLSEWDRVKPKKKKTENISIINGTRCTTHIHIWNDIVVYCLVKKINLCIFINH